MGRDLGDFQTPPELVDRILKVLGPVGRLWPRVLEPTCGTGNFITGLLRCGFPPVEIRGFEIQPKHLREAERHLGKQSGVSVDLRNADIFRTNLLTETPWSNSGPLLVLGNPPWVTNSELSSLASNNGPAKTNLRKLAGMAAMTGESNFDLGEALWIKLLSELEAENPTIALLCKMVVARNVLRFAAEQGIPIAKAEIRRIDARKWFGAAVDACLFIVRMGPGSGETTAAVYKDLFSSRPDAILEGSILCGNPTLPLNSTAADGRLSLTWRQGIKHDAVSVMELTQDLSGGWKNRAGACVNVEPEVVYPLLKSSDLFNGRQTRPRRHVIVTQKRIGEATDCLRVTAPMLWDYLQQNKEVFTRRKSSVFKGRPAFAMFGVGDYSFADYKVAVAGFYSTPRFRVVEPVNGKPCMLDDTCYFAACQSAEQASSVADVLNGHACMSFLKSLILTGAKRPVTKAILQRIDSLELFRLHDSNPSGDDQLCRFNPWESR